MTEATTSAAPALEPWARELLRCPVTGATLVDDVDADGAPVLVSTHPTDSRTYPVRDGIPVLLADEGTPTRR